MKHTKRVAAAGMLSALAVVIMLIIGLFDSFDLAAAFLGGMVVAVALIELGPGYALAVCAVASVLSAVILPNKLVCIEFIGFAGWYPIVKKYIERIRIMPLRLAVKLLLFAAIVIPVTAFELIGMQNVWYLYIFFLISLMLYDVTLQYFSVFYINNIQKKIKR